SPLPGVLWVGKGVAVALDALAVAFLFVPAGALVEQAEAGTEVGPLVAGLRRALRGKGVEPVNPAAVLDDQTLAGVVDLVVGALELDAQRRLSGEPLVFFQLVRRGGRPGRPGHVGEEPAKVAERLADQHALAGEADSVVLDVEGHAVDGPLAAKGQ